MRKLSALDKQKLGNETTPFRSVLKTTEGGGDMEIPFDKAKKLLKSNTFDVFTDIEHEQYVFLNVTTAKLPDEEDIFSKKSRILEIFPTLQPIYTSVESLIGRPGCKGCTRRKQEKKIIYAFQQLASEYPDKVPADLKFILKHIISVPSEEVIPEVTTLGKDEEDNSRVSCMQCVGKHLAQAYILLKESLQGYEGHIDNALKHIDTAVKLCPEYHRESLDEVRKGLETINSLKDDSKCVQHINSALVCLEKVLSSLEEKRSVGFWLVIGHLGEAADECVGENPEFAEEIRRERLRLMEDTTYDIPLRHLLNKAKSMQEK